MKSNLAEVCSDYIRKSSCYKAFCSKSDRLDCDGISGYPLSRLVRMMSAKRGKRLFVVAPTEDTAKSIFSDLSDVDDTRLVFYPTSGKTLYSMYSASDQEYEQKKALEEIIAMKEGIVVTSLRAFISPVLSHKALDGMSLKFRLHDEISPDDIARKLAEAGYFRSPSCYEMGAFSIRGEVIDIYPWSEENPVRIHTEWDEVVSIKEYDAMTQKTIRERSKISVSTIGGVSSSSFTTFTEYLDKSDYFVFSGEERLLTSWTALSKEALACFKEAYKEHGDVETPDKVLLNWPEFHDNKKEALRVFDIQDGPRHHYAVSQSRSYFGNVKYFKDDITALLMNDWKIIVVAPSVVQKDRLENVLRDMKVEIIVKDLSSGFQIDDENLLVVLDNEIFGRRKQKASKIVDTLSSPLDSFIDLKQGDYVVHVNYGIGRFDKIERVKGPDTERDYIKIQYADEESVYVPIEQADLVQKYIGNDGKPPKLEKLGSSSWNKKKEKAIQSAQKLALELVRLYAEREHSDGYPFLPDNDWQLEFEAAFPHTETPDQLKCLEDIKKDMESKKVMDRLICGDVGFGKTEIAFRAAFKAVMSGKQVAFLAPTVILAEQHYHNFMDRLGSFPVHSEVMTRFIPQSKVRKIKAQLEDGKCDVLFGTHKILRNINYKDLGLLIVDEEQRFGVKDKERIKQLKTSIDCLSLSATPIPRTLYMSLLKVRDMSLLTTAPRERLPVETFIEPFDWSIAISAIEMELKRGGQVFFLHNRIDDLEDIASVIRANIPYAIVESAHGQMEAEQLEDIMHRFIYEGVQVLVSTTIIENGINIPNVNTILIDNADHLGLAQLYQLRGRVGRSDKKAYCHLFYKEKSSLNEDAIKRLRVMSENTALGSGFKIAMKDMEFRGAGNILGREQSGHLEAVGLDMYMKLLDEEINRLTNEKDEPKKEVLLELDYTGFIPDSYISDPALKFEIYKKIASVDTEDRLTSLVAELEDRFGTVVEEVENLLAIAEIKVIARRMDIYHIRERNGIIEFELSRVNAINPEKMLRLIMLSNGAITLDPKRGNVIKMKTGSVSLRDKALFILEQLKRLL